MNPPPFAETDDEVFSLLHQLLMSTIIAVKEFKTGVPDNVLQDSIKCLDLGWAQTKGLTDERFTELFSRFSDSDIDVLKWLLQKAGLHEMLIRIEHFTQAF
jgi:hypothetical protein